MCERGGLVDFLAGLSRFGKMWPRHFRKKKPYTADQLRGDRCEVAARKIKKARGSGEIIHIVPSVDHCLGSVHPPGGGVITDWQFHEAVRDGDRIYDKMTGPSGMFLGDYRRLFEFWDAFTITLEEDKR